MDYPSEKKPQKQQDVDVFNLILPTIRMFFDMAWIDLHGMSLAQAKIEVERTVKYSCEKGNKRCRIITGRGNHINAKGERGVIFSQCEEWLTSPELAPLIESYEKRNGHYMLKLKTDQNFTIVLQRMGQNIVSNFYKKNLKLIQEEAEKGSSESQFRLGCGYLIGLEDLGADYKKAFAWLSRAAKQEHPYAQEFVGVLYSIGEGVHQNDGAGMDWLKKAAENGSGNAAYFLSSNYLFGWGYQPDPKQTVVWTVRGANLGDVPSMRRIGNLHFSKDPWLFGVVKNDPAKAAHWYLRAAQQGDAYSQYQLGIFYKSGIGVSIDLNESFKWLSMAAQRGDSDAILALATAYLKGEGCKKDIDSALIWLNKAVSLAHPKAIDLLSQYYLEMGNEEKAISLLEESANRGVLHSQIKLLFLPNVDSKKREQALTLLLRQPNHAIQEETEKSFQMLFSELLMYKIDTKKMEKLNRKRAVSLLENLLEEKFSAAALLLGMHFLANQSGKATAIWKAGVELGNADCMFLLGLFYSTYKKEETHETLSKMYLTMACQKNHEASMQQCASEVLLQLNPETITLEKSIEQLIKIIDLKDRDSFMLSDIDKIESKTILTLAAIFLRYRHQLTPNNEIVKRGITYLRNKFDIFENGALYYIFSLYMICYQDTFEEGMYYLGLAIKFGNEAASTVIKVILEHSTPIHQIVKTYEMTALPPLGQLRFDPAEINNLVKRRKRDVLESIILFELFSKQSQSPIFEEQNHPDSIVGTLRDRMSILALKHNSIFTQSSGLNPSAGDQKPSVVQAHSLGM